MNPTRTPFARALRATAASANGSTSMPVALAAPARIATIAHRPDPVARSSTRLPATSSGCSSRKRAIASPPAQANAQNGMAAPAMPSAASVARQTGPASSAR